MEGTTMGSGSTAKRYGVVTGANKGIGLEICRQLASNGILVILTARDEKRGIEAVKNLKAAGLSGVVFHHLNVKDPASIASLAKFDLREKFEYYVKNVRISILLSLDCEAFRAFKLGGGVVSL
ncbi:(+)-neomenthol dehydrogenase-like [Vitis riparia]|uniref:(+)-neomenthol dehydrogenase-like n=1 Tax=Vitis riparia TaxID=96939 RepID=UPI00155A4D7A|nr:(+)-neomenthol dehydrogenase-like [Vitis riparia]